MTAIAALQKKYPTDRFEHIYKKQTVSSEPGWRLKCLDCPGKVSVIRLPSSIDPVIDPHPPHSCIPLAPMRLWSTTKFISRIETTARTSTSDLGSSNHLRWRKARLPLRRYLGLVLRQVRRVGQRVRRLRVGQVRNVRARALK